MTGRDSESGGSFMQGDSDAPMGERGDFFSNSSGEEDLMNTLASTGGVVTARGTADGLVIRIDARVEEEQLEDALREFLISRSGFLKGNGVHLEWLGEKPSSSLVERVTAMMREDFDIGIHRSVEQEPFSGAASYLDPHRGGDEIAPSKQGVRLDPVHGRKSKRSRDDDESNAPISLFDGIGAVEFDEELSHFEDENFYKKERHGGSTTVDAELFDDPDARVVYGTLRSGQKIETEHSLVVCGDVNSGAEIVAGGDIFVLGTLRGVAHAGAYDETGGGRHIFAQDLRPTQLRIGTVISRGAEESGKVPELARVEGNLIVVEPYRSRSSVLCRRGA